MFSTSPRHAADPWSFAAFKEEADMHAAKLAALKDTHSGPCWLLGNGPSILATLPAIRRSGIPTIGTNKALGLLLPSFHVLCHAEHLTEEVPRFRTAADVISDFNLLSAQGRLFMHGGQGEAGIRIPISHHALFSTDLTLGACEGTPATGGSVLLVAMQLAYHLGFRTFLLAGAECYGAKFYHGGPYSERAQLRMAALWPLVAPLLASAGASAYLVGDAVAQETARNRAWPWITPEEALEKLNG